MEAMDLRQKPSNRNLELGPDEEVANVSRYTSFLGIPSKLNYTSVIINLLRFV